ncbi:MAG: hypothetical protein ACRDIU_00220 [Actinomycetota bacterium]
MKVSRKGLIIALVQALLVLAVAGKLMVDRARYPQVWVETGPVDPDLPLRGRFVRLQAIVESAESIDDRYYFERSRLEVRGNRLVAIRDDRGSVHVTRIPCRQTAVRPMDLPGDGVPRPVPVSHLSDLSQADQCLAVSESLAFFIPEGIPDPSLREPGEQLWVRVTVPPHGAPRPIRLGVKTGGKITPL